MRLNDPETAAELQALYGQYETALVNNDAETLTRMFWASPHVTRFGITENLRGIDEIAAFRKGRPPANLSRNVRRLDIVTFGRDYGSITLEFERNVDGKTVRGRQSQVWVRLPEVGESWRRMFRFFPDSLVVYLKPPSGTRVDLDLALSARANYHRTIPLQAASTLEIIILHTSPGDS